MKKNKPYQIEIFKNTDDFKVTSNLIKQYGKVAIYELHFFSDIEFEPQKTTFKWKYPAINVKGVWKPTSDFSKRIMDDWELDHMQARIAVDSPVISVFGHNDANSMTFACSDAINTTALNVLYREEDNYMYCHVSFFTEKHHKIKNYKAQLIIDTTDYHFSNALDKVSQWWSSFDQLSPIMPVSEAAKLPVYSTWYQFHQNLDTTTLIEECNKANKLGFGLIIIDDGWQTNDDNRGYDFTGDWESDRIPEMKSFVAQVHQTGMKLALWYSVPFCGKKSKAYQKFKNMLLVDEHRWAPVFDPRYPEVRDHLITIYANALKEWNLDGFKLDFIDEFRVYPNTILTMENGRDYASVNLAVDRLMTDITKTLKGIKSDLVIEFRQKYTGPAMRKYGNMFRAFDCPGDSVMNRVRIADLRMLSGETAVHSDMFTYHPNESTEIKALQVVNTLFGVPQLSILLKNASENELKMIAFYTNYWNKNKAILLQGKFTPLKPLANYPIIKAATNAHSIIGVYDDYMLDIDMNVDRIDIINAKISEEIVLNYNTIHSAYTCIVYDCMGNEVNQFSMQMNEAFKPIKVPPCGLVVCSKNK
ncbi:glycoside hydrolase family 36 protein [Aquimarina agarilytica]|uniref:glycoside hydrolase family 36 protein n=1 Tax=Aquimarina agarilytica TaxID=1087449 RepID=UPI000287DBB6|nr:glycoside hydrolase family 36 protein [Aquimarina agarilytica]